MKVIIVGCGRVGRGLAYELEKRHDKVTVIDRDPASIKTIGQYFKGKHFIGNGFDKEVLEQAGIRNVDAVVSSTSSDETNALIARIARNIYHVPKVIARLYDTRKAAIYNALGIQTISTTAWGIRHAKEMLSYRQLDTVMDIGNDEVQLVRIETPLMLVGTTVNDLSCLGEIAVVAITRGNTTFIPVYGTALECGDTLHIAVLTTSVPRLKQILGF